MTKQLFRCYSQLELGPGISRFSCAFIMKSPDRRKHFDPVESAPKQNFDSP